MEPILDSLKSRQQEALRRFQAAQAKLQIAQGEFNQANQLLQALNIIIVEETRKAQVEASANGSPATPAALPSPTPKPESVNKTEIVRSFLREHPAGVTPGDLWAQLKGQVEQRAYMYSVLKRLKDNEEVYERRGKYFFKHKQESEEARPSSTIVQ